MELDEEEWNISNFHLALVYIRQTPFRMQIPDPSPIDQILTSLAAETLPKSSHWLSKLSER